MSIAAQPDHEPADASERLRIDVRPERDVVRVVAAGDLDQSTVGALLAQLRELGDAGFAQIVLDLHRLALLDIAVIGLIVAEVHSARDDSRVISLVGGPPAIEAALSSPAAAA